jgi:hypothetical protein
VLVGKLNTATTRTRLAAPGRGRPGTPRPARQVLQVEDECHVAASGQRPPAGVSQL